MSEPPDRDSYQYRASNPPAEGYPTAPEGFPGPPEGFPPPAPAVAGYGYGQPGTQAVAPGMYIDEASGLALPQGVQLASAGRRIGSYFLAIPLSIVTLGIGYVIWGMIAWAGGQTPALQVLGMRCWRPETGRVAGWWWMALREIIGRLLEGILFPVTALLSIILMLASRDRRSLHDLVAGTVVLYDPSKVLVQRTS